MSSIGKRIRELRRSRGMSQEELGLAVGLTKATISRYESGNREPRFDQISKIASFFGVEINEILSPSQGIQVMQEFFREGNAAAKIVVDIHEKYGISLHTADSIVQFVVWAYRNEFSTTRENELREVMANLNDAGIHEVFSCAMRRAGELAEIPKYQKAAASPEAPAEPPEDEKTPQAEA